VQTMTRWDRVTCCADQVTCCADQVTCCAGPLTMRVCIGSDVSWCSACRGYLAGMPATGRCGVCVQAELCGSSDLEAPKGLGSSILSHHDMGGACAWVKSATARV
jgi:hypothetical protein